MSTHKQVKTAVLEEFLEALRVRAHEIYEERVSNGISGDSMSDWLQAEKSSGKYITLNNPLPILTSG